MFKPVRVVASVVFIASIVLVLVGAFVLNNGVCSLNFNLTRCFSDNPLSISCRFYVLVSISIFVVIFLHSMLFSSPIVFVIIEFFAYTWYTLSYIPYARTAVTKAVGLG